MISDKQIALKQENSFDLVLGDIENMQKMCSQLMKTKHYQSMGEAGLFAIVQKAKSLNINPLEALNGGLYYVNGKVGMSSEMMASLIRQAGHSIVKDSKSDDKQCILHGKRADNGDTWIVSFSMEDAKRAGLAKNMYDKYPAIMLYNRAMSMLARQLFPDVIKGAGYTMEELHEIKDRSSQHFTVLEDDNAVIVEPTKTCITSKQIEEITAILQDCPQEFTMNVNNWILNSRGSIEKLDDKDYLSIMTKAKKKISETQTHEGSVNEPQAA